MTVGNRIALIVLLAFAGIIALLFGVDCAMTAINPPPPTATPQPVFGIWRAVSEDEVENIIAPFSVRCFQGELAAYVGRFAGSPTGQQAEEGDVTAKVLRRDGTVVKHFQHTEALKAYMSVTKSTRMQGVVGSIPLEYRFRLGNSGEFVQALIEGDTVEMSLRGSYGLLSQSTWKQDVGRLDGLADAVEFLNCGGS